MFPAGFSLQFSIPNVYEGFAVANGVAQTSENELIIEFETKDAVLGMLKSGIKQVRINDAELSSIYLKMGWFRTRLLIRTKSMAALAEVPGNESGQVTLRIARKDRRAAQNLVSALVLHLSERQLASLSKVMPASVSRIDG